MRTLTNEMSAAEVSAGIVDKLNYMFSVDVPAVTIKSYEQIGERAFRIAFYVLEEGSHILPDESAKCAVDLGTTAIRAVDYLLRDIEAQFAVDYRSYSQVDREAKAEVCILVFLDAQVDSHATKMQVPCAECSGTGRIEKRDSDFIDLERCPKCDGSGVMEIDVAPPKEKETLKMIVLSGRRTGRRSIDLS